MGGTGVALGGGEYALFQNPAALAGQETRSARLLGLGLEASLDTYSVFGSSLNAVKNFSANDLNQIMNKNIFFRAGATPLIQLPHFSIAYVVDAQGAITGYNQANPTFNLGDMITHGVQAGTGWSFKSGKRAKDEFRFGITGKLLFRRGGYYDITTSGYLQATNSGKSYINSIVGNYGMGYGADTGMQYIYRPDKLSEIVFGSAITDIGGTHFSVATAQTIPMSWSTGVGYKRTVNMMKLGVEADIRDINQSMAFSNKVHIGGSVGIPLLDFYAGLGQMDLSYGFAFDLWIMRVSFTSYAEELGVYQGQDTSRRYLMQFDFKLPI